MLFEPYAEVTDLYETPHTLITIVKNGPVPVERAFDLYVAHANTPLEHALRVLVEHPYLSVSPHRMFDVHRPDANLSVQLIDVTDGLETHLTHSVYDDSPVGIEAEPDTIIIACPLPQDLEDAVYTWAHLRSVKITMFDDIGPYADLNLGPLRS